MDISSACHVNTRESATSWSHAIYRTKAIRNGLILKSALAPTRTCRNGLSRELRLVSMWSSLSHIRSKKVRDDEIAGAAFSQSIARLQLASSAAVSVLVKIMVDPDAPASSRVRAADVVLERFQRQSS